MKTYIISSLNNIMRVLSLFLHPWLNSLGAVGAWVLTILGCVAALFALWGVLWLGFIAGMTM
ncbi:MAG: hypothetical protein K2H46_02460 [Muribaculaceae bacterium]|nr:hypothetical protein [Muribaculaceae bacterium]